MYYANKFLYNPALLIHWQIDIDIFVQKYCYLWKTCFVGFLYILLWPLPICMQCCRNQKEKTSEYKVNAYS